MINHCFSGNKLIGVQMLQQYFNTLPNETLHIGDQVSHLCIFYSICLTTKLFMYNFFAVSVNWKRLCNAQAVLYSMDYQSRRDTWRFDRVRRIARSEILSFSLECSIRLQKLFYQWMCSTSYWQSKSSCLTCETITFSIFFILINVTLM